MLREALADLKRKREDDKANKQKSVRVLVGGKEEECLSMNLKVGDVIVIEDEHFVPADCFVLQSTRNDQG